MACHHDTGGVYVCRKPLRKPGVCLRTDGLCGDVAAVYCPGAGMVSSGAKTFVFFTGRVGKVQQVGRQRESYRTGYDIYYSGLCDDLSASLCTGRLQDKQDRLEYGGRVRMEEMICVKNVSKKFGQQTVLSHISLSMEAGKIYGLVGYNGSGKTVLMKCICGLLLADEGDIHVKGEKIGEQMIKNAGVIIEEPAFLKNESGKKNLQLLYMLNHKKDNVKIERVMKKVGLDAGNRKKVRHYSLGMRQRLAIAQAVMEDPEILILDEPMNGLDKQGVGEIRELLLSYKEEGKVILLASHNREDIQILCDEVYEIEEGRLERI